MRVIGVNLATRPFRNNALHWIAFAAGLLALGAFTFFNVDRFIATRAEVTDLSAGIEASQSALLELSGEVDSMNADLGSIDLKSLDEKSGFANAIIVGRLFSWTQLFDRLEEVFPENIRLRSVQPTIGKEGIEVTIDGMARDHASILKLEESLIDSDYFTFVYPLQESSRESKGEIHFNLAFGYVPAGKSALGTASGSGVPAPVPPAEGAAGAVTEAPTGPGGAGGAAGAPSPREDAVPGEEGAGAPAADANAPGGTEGAP